MDGTKRVVEWLRDRGERIDWCIVGEPSSERMLGDTVKIGRRGSLSGRLTVHGVQGHIAYPQLADNPVHRFAPALAELASRVWDQGNEYFQPTSFQISNLTAGTGTAPGTLSSAVSAAIGSVTGSQPQYSTSGGTSDGRFIAPLGAQVVELGVINASIHKVNESVRVADIDALHAIYFDSLRKLLT